MAAGDTVIAHASVNAAASQTLQPGASIEWLITNLYFGAAYEVYRTDGSNTILISSGTTVGYEPVELRATNAYYFTIKNVSVGAAYFGYDGIVWK